MESFKKAAMIFSGFVLFAGCLGVPEIEDPLILQEIAPLPRTMVANKPAVEYEPVYANYRIIEVSEVNGVQRFFLVRLGSDKTGIQTGVTGDISEDAAFQNIIGNYKIIEVFNDFIRCEIVELSYRIGSTAYMRVQTGEKIKEPAP
ncbi:MAG: hypothetical protein LBP76_11795 [Treponema sp.]|jgi:hypothetical protein|nr:hypothetical protein [Treponema sp.]